MMRFVKALAAALVAISMAAGSAVAQTDATPESRIVLAQAKKSAPAARNTGTHVYLLRGFMDVFSTGMNDLGTKLARQGIRATVHNHSEFLSIADEIGSRHRRGIRENVVIIGHSLGANDAFRMAERLDDFGVSVPLIIAFDPTATMSAGRNISRVVNFYSSTNGWGVAIARGPGFRGSLANIDLSRRGEVGHTDIDKSPALHSQAIGYIRSVGGSRSSTATASPKQEPAGQEGGIKSDEKSAAKESTAGSPAAKSETADKKETADPSANAKADVKPATEAKAATDVKPATEVKAAAKDTAPESTASVAAKPASEKTETAASKPVTPATSN